LSDQKNKKANPEANNQGIQGRKSFKKDEESLLRMNFLYQSA